MTTIHRGNGPKKPEGFTLPVDAKPLFRPDVIRAHLAGFSLPERIEPRRRQLADWASLLSTGRANQFKEQELLPEFLTVYFHVQWRRGHSYQFP